MDSFKLGRYLVSTLILLLFVRYPYTALWCVYKVLKISLCLFIFFYCSAIAGGELTYRRGIRRKLTLALRPQRILMVSSLRKREVVLKAHHNIMFYYIYLRVKKVKVLKSFFNVNFIFRVLFFLATGVSWFFVVFLGKIIRSPKIEAFMLREFYNNDEESLLLLTRGEWDHNGVGLDQIKSILATSCAKRGVSAEVWEKGARSIEKILLQSQEKRNFMYREYFSVKWGKLYGKDWLPAHMITNNFTTDGKVAFFTDEKKSALKGDYGLEKIVNRVELKKDTAILSQERECLYMPREDDVIYMPKIIVATGALKHGYSPTNMRDEFKSNLIDLELSMRVVRKECVEVGLGEREIEEILRICSIIISGI